MIDQLIQQFQKELASNQFLSGGLILGTATALLVYLKSVPVSIWNWIRRRINFEVTIEQTDELYPIFQAWINKFHKDELRIVKANYTKKWENSSPQPLYEGGDKKTYVEQGKIVYNQYGDTFRIWRNGRLLRISSEREKNTNSSSSSFYIWERYYISGLMAKKEIVSLLEEVVDFGTQLELSMKQPKMLIYYWDCWNTIDGVKMRDLESIFIDSEKKIGLIEDISSFVESKDFFHNRNIPYRRGYLLHGPPGTGKSSLVSALAKYFRKDLYVANLTAFDKDSEFEKAISRISPGGILLIEDIDRYYAQDKAQTKINYSTFINSISGVKYCENVIVIITTNHPSKIDAALMRSGRLDVHVELGYPAAKEANEYLAWFFDCKNRHWFSDPITFSIADLENACVVNRTSIGDAITQVTTNTRLAVNQ